MHCAESFHTGSSFICNPPVTNTDIDIAVHITCGFATFEQKLRDEYRDAVTITRTYGNSEFMSARYLIYNLIVFMERGSFYRFYDATMLAKDLKLNEKAQRIALFDIIMGKQHYRLPWHHYEIIPVIDYI